MYLLLKLFMSEHLYAGAGEMDDDLAYECARELG
jgi:hypothetical protein